MLGALDFKGLEILGAQLLKIVCFEQMGDQIVMKSSMVARGAI